MLSTPNFIERTSGIGILDRKIARDFSPVGPLMRGSGYARDVRFDHPFDGYADPDVQKMHAATADTCDAFGRTAVRIQEVYDSIDMIETMLENCPSGPILTTDWEYTPHKYAIGATEAPRGEDVHWAMLGNNQKCYRWRAKAATYSNWPVLRYMFRGNTVLLLHRPRDGDQCRRQARPRARQGAVRERLARQVAARGRGHHGRSAR